MRRPHHYVVLFLLLWSPLGARADTSSDSVVTLQLDEQLRSLTLRQRDDVVWLARCIYSESNLAHEQRLVAWVVRNRVETQFRGRSYRSVVLEPYQFSAFNEPNARRKHILGLDLNSRYGPWREALEIALDVYRAPAEERPFSLTTRHFYSPVSMRGGKTPHWAIGEEALDLSRFGVNTRRFQFFNSIDDAYQRSLAASDSGYTDDTLDQTDAAPEVRPFAGRKRTLTHRVRLSGRVARPVRPSARRLRD